MADGIVADSGPLIALARIEFLDLLPALFRKILVPTAVEQECCRDLALPGALAIRAAIDAGRLSVEQAPEALSARWPPGLGPGERATIALALARRALVLMDDRLGRQVAAGHGLGLVGVGGVLLKARSEGRIPAVGPLLVRLRGYGYRISQALVDDFLRRAGEA